MVDKIISVQPRPVYFLCPLTDHYGLKCFHFDAPAAADTVTQRGCSEITQNFRTVYEFSSHLHYLNENLIYNNF